MEIDNGKHTVHADSVIIATGASAKWLGSRARSVCVTQVEACPHAQCVTFFTAADVAIVGAGDTAAEEASYLAKLCNKVHMLVRRDEMRASKAMQHRVENLENIEIHWNTETVEVLGEEGVTGVRVKNNKTGEESTLDITGFFVAIGHKPNTDVFADWLDLNDAGYIINQPGSSKTNREGVFVSGDAADHVYRQAVTAAGTGCMAALDAERYLAAKGIH